MSKILWVKIIILNNSLRIKCTFDADVDLYLINTSKCSQCRKKKSRWDWTVITKQVAVKPEREWHPTQGGKSEHLHFEIGWINTYCWRQSDFSWAGKQNNILRQQGGRTWQNNVLKREWHSNIKGRAGRHGDIYGDDVSYSGIFCGAEDLPSGVRAGWMQDSFLLSNNDIVGKVASFIFISFLARGIILAWEASSSAIGGNLSREAALSASGWNMVKAFSQSASWAEQRRLSC